MATELNQSVLEGLAAEVGACLQQSSNTLVTAESCTGGWVGQCLTAIAGSSVWYDCGFITYSNFAKMRMLNVPQSTLDAHGAVSEATARAMAWGALTNSGADWALAITGIAGPTGGSREKPVGTVCFAWARRDGDCDSVTRQFEGNRIAIRMQAVALALSGLRDRVQFRAVA